MGTFRWWLIILCGALAAGPAMADGAEKKQRPVLAVFNTDDRNTKLERAVLDMLSDDLTAGVEKALPGFKVVAPRVLKRAMVDALRGKFDECFDKLCQFTLAQEVDADFVLASTLTKVGSHCILAATIWDVDRKVSVAAATAKGGCDRVALIRSVNQAGRDFQNKLRLPATKKPATMKPAIVKPAPK